MSRSGYSDDCENLQLWRGAVDRATFGKRGQAFLRKLSAALDAMAEKRLITNDFSNEHGVCALGAVNPDPRLSDGRPIEPDDRYEVAEAFGIAPALASEIVYMNDEMPYHIETPEQRWQRMREWVRKQIGPDEFAVEQTQEQP